MHLTVFGLQPVIKYGNERLKSEFLPRAVSGDLHVAFGVTEPNAGTDTSRISTKAVKQSDGNWKITGQKIWTSKALESEVVLLLVRTSNDEKDRFGGLTLFLADLDPRHVVIRPIRKAGRNAVASCETFYEELPVEDWRMVGEEGRGFYHILAGLNAERILLAATAIGIGEVALKKAVEYAGQREVFGKPIGSNQAISHPLADAHARLKAAWQMVLLAAWKCDNGLPCGEEANTAKYLAAEAGYMAADRAMQTLGGLGYATEYHVERYWREARVIRIAPVSQEMTLNYLAQNVLGLPKSY
jgi:acyl-CoA dehydrogenase